MRYSPDYQVVQHGCCYGHFMPVSEPFKPYKPYKFDYFRVGCFAFKPTPNRAARIHRSHKKALRALIRRLGN